MGTTRRNTAPRDGASSSPLELPDRLPPQSLEAEMAVLGCCLMSQAAMLTAAERLTPEAFYMQAHRRIFSAMLALQNEGHAVDFLTVGEELRQREELDAAGGSAYLFTLTESVATAVHVEHYVRPVLDTATRRRLLEACREIEASAYDEAEPTETVVERAETRVLSVRRAEQEATLVSGPDLSIAAADHFHARMTGAAEEAGIQVGFPKFDWMTRGLKRGALYVIAGRPSEGKTSLALQWAWHVVLRGGAAVVYSLEMDIAEVRDRMLGQHARVNLQEMEAGDLSAAEEMRFNEAINLLASFEERIAITDRSNPTVAEIAAQARRRQQKHGLDLLVIDYLQLMDAPGRGENRNQELASITRGLKQLARELRVAVVLISQMNREIERAAGAGGRKDEAEKPRPKPTLAHLRDSGAIEADADLVGFLWHPRGLPEDPGADEVFPCSLLVYKHRGGPRGSVPLLFRPCLSLFDSAEERRDDDEAPPDWRTFAGDDDA